MQFFPIEDNLISWAIVLLIFVIAWFARSAVMKSMKEDKSDDDANNDTMSAMPKPRMEVIGNNYDTQKESSLLPDNQDVAIRRRKILSSKERFGHDRGPTIDTDAMDPRDPTNPKHHRPAYQFSVKGPGKPDRDGMMHAKKESMMISPGPNDTSEPMYRYFNQGGPSSGLIKDGFNTTLGEGDSTIGM